MRSLVSTRSTATLAFVLLMSLLVVGSTPAQAAEFSVFGSYMDSDDLQDAPGVGFRVAFFEQFQLQITASWYDKFDGIVLEQSGAVQLPGGATARVAPIDLIPVDVGGAYYFNDDATGAYLGAGLSYFFLESSLGNTNTDDELGFYAQFGYQSGGGFFAELVYRLAEGSLEGVPVVGPERFRTVKYDLNAIAVSAGWRF